MASIQKTAIFMYATRSIQILCTGKEKVNEIFEKFKNKFNSDSRIKDYNFYYEGNKIEPDTYEQPIEKNELFGEKESFIISVEKNIKIIKCPQCNYDDCVVSLLNYRTIFYNCEHYHLQISSYDNYFQDQIFFPERILCSDEKCKKNGKMDPNFSLCLTCSKLLNRTKSICSECIKQHKQKNHKVIKYEDKNYYCQKHIKKFEKYCFQCKKSLCEGCVNEHLIDRKYDGHQIKSIDLLIPEEKEITELKDSFKEIKKNLEALQIIINNLTYTLNGTMRIYENYYKIANHIFEKYETFNKGKEKDDFKNFTIFKCLRNLKFSNSQILKDLREIINEKDKIRNAKKLIEIYDKKKKVYYANDKEGVDLNKEDDSEWLKEVLEREKKNEKKDENGLKDTTKKKNEKHKIINKK